MADTSKTSGEKFDLTVEKKDEKAEAKAPRRDAGNTPTDISADAAKDDPAAFSGRPAPVAAKKDETKEPPIQSRADERLAGVGEGDDRDAGEPFEDLPPGAANKNMALEELHGPDRDTTGANVPFVSNADRAARDKRLRLADDGSRIEERPLTHPGLVSESRKTDVAYSVEQELREQWPEIELGDAEAE